MISSYKASNFINENIKNKLSLTTSNLLLEHSPFRILGENLNAIYDQPPFDRVSMDGIAINFESLSKSSHFPIEGIQAAGHEIKTLLNKMNCIEVMTGAPLPRGCDTVIPYEVIEIQNNKAFILNAKEVHIGQNIHLKGSDYKKNTLLLSKNSIIQPRHISILASSGIKTVQVKTNPKIAIISIGDELIDPGLDLLPHQIFRSNPFALRALCAVHHLPVETLAHLPDVQDRMLAELKIIFSQHEIIILSGAVSKGKFDFLPAVLHELGVKKIFHQVRQRPGKPLYFGCGRENQLVFGLPGNPVSSVVNLRKYVINALKNIDSPTMYVHLTESINVTNDMTFFIPAKLEYTRDGLVIARPIQGNGSGDFYSLKESDGFIEVDNLSGSNNFSAGSVLPFYHWNY